VDSVVSASPLGKNGILRNATGVCCSDDLFSGKLLCPIIQFCWTNVSSTTSVKQPECLR